MQKFSKYDSYVELTRSSHLFLSLQNDTLVFHKNFNYKKFTLSMYNWKINEKQTSNVATAERENKINFKRNTRLQEGTLKHEKLKWIWCASVLREWTIEKLFSCLFVSQVYIINMLSVSDNLDVLAPVLFRILIASPAKMESFTASSYFKIKTKGNMDANEMQPARFI